MTHKSDKRENAQSVPVEKRIISAQPDLALPVSFRESVLAAILVAGALALAYGPDKASGHSIYGGVIQDVTNIYGFACWDDFSRSELLAGRFPLWNPHGAFGVPHLANMQSSIFFPLNLVKWAFGFWTCIDALIMARLWLAGFFTFLLARKSLGVGFWPAMASAVAFALTGYMTRYVYMSHLNVETLIPLQAFLMVLLAQRASIVRFLAAGLGFALLVLGGFPEASLYAVLFALAWYFLAAGLTPRAAFTAAGCAALGLIISLPQTLPFAEYLANAWTYHGPGSGARSLDPKFLITLVMPWFFGENGQSPAGSFLAPYLGVMPVFLALAGIGVARKRGAFGAGLIVLTIILAGVVFGVAPFRWIGNIYPFSVTYNEKYALACLALSVSLLAALGAENLLSGKSWKAPALAGGGMIAFIGLNIIAGLPSVNWFSPVWAFGLLKPWTILTSVFLLLSALFLSRPSVKRTISGRAMGASLFVLLLLGLLFDARGNNPNWNDDLESRVGALRNRLPASEGRYRVHVDPTIKDLFPNLTLPAGVDDVRYYDPLYPRSYVDYMAGINGLEGEQILESYNENMLFTIGRDHLTVPLAEVANVSLLVLPTPWDERLVDRDLLMNAVTISSRKESWLRLEETSCFGEKKRSLIEHAPVRIEGMVEARMKESSSGDAAPSASREEVEIKFEVGMPDDQTLAGGAPGDGAFMTAFKSGKDGEIILFSRYIDPKNNFSDLGWKPYEARACTLRPGVSSPAMEWKLALTLLPGPRGDLTRDAAAWADLRLKSPTDMGVVKRIGEGGPPFVYANENSMKRAAVFTGLARVPKGQTVIEAMRETGANLPVMLRKMAYINEVPPQRGKLKDTKPADEDLETRERLPGRVEYKVGSRSSGYLFLSDQYFPGWRAFRQSADERVEEKILNVNGAFMAVFLPPGESVITLVYAPWGFRAGLWAGLSSLLFGLVPVLYSSGGKIRGPGRTPGKSGE